MFSQRLKQLRKSFGITQTEFAKEFNISQGTIGMWETGQRTPDVEMLSKIAKRFNVSIDYLLGKEETKILPATNEELIEVIRQHNKGKAQIFFCGADGKVVEVPPEAEAILQSVIDTFNKKDSK